MGQIFQHEPEPWDFNDVTRTDEEEQELRRFVEIVSSTPHLFVVLGWVGFLNFAGEGDHSIPALVSSAKAPPATLIILEHLVPIVAVERSPDGIKWLNRLFLCIHETANKPINIPRFAPLALMRGFAYPEPDYERRSKRFLGFCPKDTDPMSLPETIMLSDSETMDDVAPVLWDVFTQVINGYYQQKLVGNSDVLEEEIIG